MTLPRSLLGSAQNLLLRRWHDVLDDLRGLCNSLARLPSACPCGDAVAHLSGECLCCQTDRRAGKADGPDCRAILAGLRPRVDGLLVDTMRFSPLVKLFLNAPEKSPLRDQGERVELLISLVVRTFGRLVAAVDEFESGCRTSHLRALKREATTLLAEVQHLDEHLEHRR